MTNFEMVEQLRAKANVSYEEAKAALEEANWDMLDAIVILEKQGKMKGDGASSYTTKREAPQEDKESSRQRVSNVFGRVGKGLVRLIEAGNKNVLEISRKGHTIVSVPLTAVVLVILLTWFWSLVALVVGLFCGFHYALRGPGIKSDAINSAIDKASEVADNLKRDIQSGHNTDDAE